jgi:hypothetical protein
MGPRWQCPKHPRSRPCCTLRASHRRLWLSPWRAPALLDEFPNVVSSGTFDDVVEFIDGGVIEFDLSGAGGLVVATTNDNGAPTISATGHSAGRVYTIAYLDLPGTTVAWDPMFVVASGEENSTNGGPNELLVTRWVCLTLPGFGTKLYQLTGKLFVL